MCVASGVESREKSAELDVESESEASDKKQQQPDSDDCSLEKLGKLVSGSSNSVTDDLC